jgi:hypothetical protein
LGAILFSKEGDDGVDVFLENQSEKRIVHGVKTRWVPDFWVNDVSNWVYVELEDLKKWNLPNSSGVSSWPLSKLKSLNSRKLADRKRMFSKFL